MQRENTSGGSDCLADQHLGHRNSSADQLDALFGGLPDIEDLFEEHPCVPSTQCESDASSSVHQATASKKRDASDVEQGTSTVSQSFIMVSLIPVL
jgi:hypothetical protein